MMESQQLGDAAIGNLSQVFPDETAYFLELRRFNSAGLQTDPLDALVNPPETVSTFVRPSEKEALRDFLPTLGVLSLQSVLDEIGPITVTEMYETLERTRSRVPTSRYQATDERKQLENRLLARHWPLESARSNILGSQVSELLVYMAPKKLREINIARYASRLWLREHTESEQYTLESKVTLSLQYAVSDTLLEMHSQAETGETIDAPCFAQHGKSVETIFSRREKAAANIIDFVFMGFPMPEGEAAPITRLLSNLA
jgi:hypothetical protein